MNIPQRWIDVLRQLHESGFPEAIIAGGALRDLDNERPIKDVDIFVRNRGVMTKAMLEKAFGYKVSDTKIDFNVCDENGTPDGSAASDVEETYDLTDWSGVRLICSFDHTEGNRRFLAIGAPIPEVSEPPTPFEIIAVADPSDANDFALMILGDFDIGFCQIAYDKDGLWSVWAYDLDKANQTLTVVKADKGGSLDRTKKRLERIQQKYPEWRIVIPEEFTLAQEEPAF